MLLLKGMFYATNCECYANERFLAELIKTAYIFKMRFQNKNKHI